MEPIIEIHNISFSAQSEQIVRNISYIFEEGKATALIGPSGGGKSSLLKLAAGLILPTSGTVTYRGQDIFMMNRTQELAFRKDSAFVFQDSALWANQSLRQILELPLKIHFPHMKTADRDERIMQTLKETGYKKQIDIRPAALSMGEQKLVAFARAMLCDPNLIYLDEWTESLDDIAATRLIRIIKRKKEEKKTVIFVSHNLDVIQKLADVICIVEEGKLVQVLKREDITSGEDLTMMIEKGITL